jgi:hypothetical protein
MFCGECGAQNPDTNQFCRNCGKPLARRQPSAQPAPPLAPVPVYPAAQPAPAPAIPSQQPVAAAVSAPAASPAPGRQWNWLGIISIILGILSWIIMTGIFALSAILLGIAGLVLFRRATGRIGISSVIGIIFAIAAIAVMTAIP